MDAQLNTIEAMLQLTLEAICSLAKELTGKSMCIGLHDGYQSIGATPLSPSIIWVDERPHAALATASPLQPHNDSQECEASEFALR